MKPHSSLTHDDLKSLFAWLDPDPNRAIAKYEVIQRGLIERFINRGCMDAESLADETIDRVTKKVAEISTTYVGNPANYFHGVAKRVFLEYCRKRRVEATRPPPEPEPTFSEIYYDCLELCLGALPLEKRDLILRYYAEMKSAKIESRKEIRQKMSLKPNALRVRTHRIRKTLERCVSECVERNETV
jgi:DNA-directed RNA polymerase specialized sigma24 family protein